MLFDTISKFSDTLLSCKQSAYISMNGSEFQVVSKENKNLNTKAIADLVEGYFNEISNNKTIPLTKRMEIEEKLANSLKLHSSRIFSSKPWYYKILAFFGFKSRDEKRIDGVISRLLVKIESEKKYIKKAERYKSCKVDDFSYSNTLNFQAKIHYHKMKEETKRQKILDGLPFNMSIASIIEDLRNFNETTSNETIKQLIENLEFTLSCTILEYGEKLELLADKVFDSIHSMAIPKNSEKSRLILPGGFKKHAALYIIERHQDERYSFRIFNTGSGLDLLFSNNSLDAEGKVHYSNMLSKPKQKLACSYQYTNLTLEQLSQPFLKSLFEGNVNNPSMALSKELIDKSLNLNGNQVTHTSHEIQRRGTCTIRCLIEFIKMELDVVSASRFEEFIIESATKKINTSWILPCYIKILSVIDRFKNIWTISKNPIEKNLFFMVRLARGCPQEKLTSLFKQWMKTYEKSYAGTAKEAFQSKLNSALIVDHQ